MNLRKTITLFISLIILVSCSKIGKPADFDYGKVNKGEYTNNYFNFKLITPKDWNVQNQQQIETLQKKGEELITNEKIKATIEISKINTAYLFSIFKYKQDSAVNFNPNFISIAENIGLAPSIKTGKDYLFETRKILQSSNAIYSSISEDFELKEIDGIEFYIMTTKIKNPQFEVSQQFYSTISNGFSLNFILSYVTDEDKGILEKSLYSLDFKSK